MTTTINVAFTDSTKMAVASYFSAPQNASVFPNQAVIETSDPLWLTFYNQMWKVGVASGLPVPDNWTAPGA